jgi:hypothetical protein
MSLVVSPEDVKSFERLKAISQIAPIKEKIRSRVAFCFCCSS